MNLNEAAAQLVRRARAYLQPWDLKNLELEAEAMEELAGPSATAFSQVRATNNVIQLELVVLTDFALMDLTIEGRKVSQSTMSLAHVEQVLLMHDGHSLSMEVLGASHTPGMGGGLSYATSNAVDERELRRFHRAIVHAIHEAHR